MATMSLQAAYDQARSYLEANRVDHAIGVAQHILDQLPENLEAHRILGEASFRKQNGEVNGRDPGQGNMACYEVANSHDASIELRKVVKDSVATNERAGDYLPLMRVNGQRSANLVFSVPGFGLGGATTDHFVAGTKFQRVQVPTFSDVPSITIPLWTKNAAGRYLKHSGDLRFFYGFMRASDGAKRFGWMAEDALQTSTGC